MEVVYKFLEKLNTGERALSGFSLFYSNTDVKEGKN
jgi:hypothetical protein